VSALVDEILPREVTPHEKGVPNVRSAPGDVIHGEYVMPVWYVGGGGGAG